MVTKVKHRQKPLADGRLSLYLDFYPPISDPVTGQKKRREFLHLHIWERPKGSLQRQHNADTLFVAEQIRFERENALLKSNIYSDLEKEHHPPKPHPTTISRQPPHIIFENHAPILSHRPHHHRLPTCLNPRPGNHLPADRQSRPMPHRKDHAIQPGHRP